MRVKLDIEHHSVHEGLEDLVTIQQEVLAAQESLMDAGIELTEATFAIDCMNVCMECLKNDHDGDMIAAVNVDGGLESLLGLEEAKITVDAAQEGMGEAIRSMWEKFKAALRRFWESVKSFFGAKKEMADKKIAVAEKTIDEGIKEVQSATPMMLELKESNVEQKAQVVNPQKAKDPEKKSGFIQTLKKFFEDPIADAKQIDDFITVTNAAFRSVGSALGACVTSIMHAKPEESINPFESTFYSVCEKWLGELVRNHKGCSIASNTINASDRCAFKVDDWDAFYPVRQKGKSLKELHYDAQTLQGMRSRIPNLRQYFDNIAGDTSNKLADLIEGLTKAADGVKTDEQYKTLHEALTRKARVIQSLQKYHNNIMSIGITAIDHMTKDVGLATKRLRSCK